MQIKNNGLAGTGLFKGVDAAVNNFSIGKTIDKAVGGANEVGGILFGSAPVALAIAGAAGSAGYQSMMGDGGLVDTVRSAPARFKGELSALDMAWKGWGLTVDVLGDAAVTGLMAYTAFRAVDSLGDAIRTRADKSE